MYRLISGCLLLGAFGCQPQSESPSPRQLAPSSKQTTASSSATNLRLKQIVASGNNGGLGPFFTTTYFSYEQGRMLRKAIIPAPSPGADGLTNEYTYDQQGQLSTYQVRYARPIGDGSVAQLNLFSFANNTIAQSYARLGADGQRIPITQEPNARNIYRLNEQGQITEHIMEGIIRFGQETRARYVYSYENGNIVKAAYLNGDDQVEFTIRYQYDDKVNPFYKWIYIPDPVLYSSHNNIISTQINNNTPSWRKYTYNEQGLPLTQTYVSQGAVLQYDYESY